jgi:hypothetical protein
MSQRCTFAVIPASPLNDAQSVRNLEQATRSSHLASSAITNEMFAKEPNDARVEVTVKGRSVKAGRIGTKTRQVRRELRRARCQEGKVTGRNGVNVRRARQAVGGDGGVFRIHVSASQFRSPDQQGDLDLCQAFPGKHIVQWSVGKHSGPDSRLARQVGWNVASAKLLTM